MAVFYYTYNEKMRTTSASVVRKNNTRNRILSLIRERYKISKTQLKQETGYSMATVLSTVDELLSENLIFYAEKGNALSGRKPTFISLNPKGGYFVGITFNATDMSAAILDYSGEMLHYFSEPFIPSKLSVEYVLDRLAVNLFKTLEILKDKQEPIIGIGVGAPGYLDENSGISIFYPHIPQWQNVDVHGFLKPLVPNIPVYIEHNTNGMALAYKWLRPEYRSMCYIIISIRSGVRMSCVFENRLYKGKNYTAGEIGHIRINGSRRYCPCGKYGCLESEVSEIAIRERILEGIKVNRYTRLWEGAGKNIENISIDSFIQGVLVEDSECLILLDEICDFLGESITQLLNILNPDKVILSTKLNKIGLPFYSRLRKKINESAIFVALQDYTLEATDFGDTLAAVGAACIVMDNKLTYVDAIV
jgi:predicted NBD/HSP70 family sugar kinase